MYTIDFNQFTTKIIAELLKGSLRNHEVGYASFRGLLQADSPRQANYQLLPEFDAVFECQDKSHRLVTFFTYFSCQIFI